MSYAGTAVALAFEYHVQGNLIAPALPDQGDHPLRDLLLPLLADQDVRPAPLLHLLHGLAALADDHADGGAGHHHPDRPLALSVSVVELTVPLLHLRVIFNIEIYVADFGNFKQGFLSMKLIQKSISRVQGMFLSTIVLRKIKTRHTLKKALEVIPV